MRLPAEKVFNSIDRCKTGRDAHMDPSMYKLFYLNRIVFSEWFEARKNPISSNSTRQ
jgi:hypothetical protein